MQRSALTARRLGGRRLPPLALTLALPLALPLAAAACAESGAAARSAVARDSAGVAIVESAGPAWGPEQAIVLADAPAVRIGAEDDRPEYQFGRVTAAVRLADGGIAVFEGMANELRWYDAQGTFVRKAGGSGGGPGEYRFVSWMRRLPGDSLMLHDMMAQRITVVAPDGTVGRTVNLAAASPPPAAETSGPGGRSRVVMSGLGRWRIVAPFADGTMLARAGGAPPMEGSGSVARDSVVYVRLAPDGTVRDTLGTFVGDETIVTTAGSGGNMAVMVGPPPFGRTTQVAVDRDGFWLGTQDRYELRRYDAAGRLVRIVRRPVEPLALTDEDVAERKRQDLESQVTVGNRGEDPNFKRMVEQRWENAKIPAAMPAHGSLVADATGHLWVRETTRPADQVPKWTVFHPDGHMLGTIAMPESFRPLDVGADYVLGVEKDESDVEQVALYPLRPAGR